MNYWYASKPNEIFLDLDSKRAIGRALNVLRVAIRTKRLPVLSIWMFPTRQKQHAHLIIVLKHAMWVTERLAWSLWMGNDRLRVAYVLQRLTDGRIPYPWTGDLLVTTSPYLFRKSDFVADGICDCVGKHKDDTVTLACPVMRKLLGKAHSADYFARTGPGPVKKNPVRVPWGRISRKLILNWEASLARKTKRV